MSDIDEGRRPLSHESLDELASASIAHGESLTGHDLDPAQAADFERVRQNFALAARTEDD